jgi:hypothetical protein
MTTTTATNRPELEVADIVRAHGAAYVAAHAGHLSDAHERALHELAVCRTAALGGHTEEYAACSAAIPVRCKWSVPMAAEQAA